MILSQITNSTSHPDLMEAARLILKHSLLLFAVVNPVGNIPVYADLTRQLKETERGHVMNQAVFTALGIVVVFAVLGDWCLVNLFGVTLAELKVAGGLLLFMVALRGVIPTGPHLLPPSNDDPRMLAVFPIAFPIMVGPGAITVTIITTQAIGRLSMLITACVTFVFVFLIARNASRCMKVIGPYVGMIVGRLLYIFLAAKAMSMVMSGIKTVMPGWRGGNRMKSKTSQDSKSSPPVTAAAEIVRLQESARTLRQLIFTTICRAGGGHIPTCLSVVELLTVLYEKIVRVSPATIKSPERDRFILSKGHAGVALYCQLARQGFITMEMLATHGRPGTVLGGHPDMYKVPGVEASTGALGHGLAFGAGMALAGKIDRKDYKVYVLMGDGECQEGSVWEAAMFAPQMKLDNLIGIVDYNKLQALDRLEKIVGLEPLADKWRAFGWAVREVDGHSFEQLLSALGQTPLEPGRPTMIIAHTIKGRGISFMENVPIWHYRMPNEEEMKIARMELGIEEDQS